MKGFFILCLLFSFVACEISLAPLSEDPNDRQQRQEDDDGLVVRINQYEKEVFDLINTYRVEQGLNKLKWVNQAVLEAQYHSEYMDDYQVVNHLNLSRRINAIAVEEELSIDAYAENVGQNKDAKNMVQAWINSLGHRRNLLGNYTHTGIGQAGSGDKKYFTQIFLRVRK
jgi:uncharacterized protein YkwD